MKKRLFALFSAVVFAAAFTGCASRGADEKSSSSAAAAEQVEDILFTVDGYSITLTGSKWMNRDKYIADLKEKGYTFDEEDIAGSEAEGCYYFIDNTVKDGEDFTYDVPHLTVGAPMRSGYFKDRNIEDEIEERFESKKKSCDKIDGMEFSEDESGIREINGNKFLKLTVRNHLANGEINLVIMSYEIYAKATKFSFTFSSTEELASKMESEYEQVLSTFTA